MTAFNNIFPSYKSALGRALRMPMRLLPRDVVVRVLSGPNRGMKWIRGAGITNACWVGNYEADHLAALPALVKPGMIVYDIGAHTGYFTLALSQLVGEKGHVYAFEPEARNVYFLRRHIKLNNLSNVTVVQAAISDKAGMVGFDDIRFTKGSQYLVPTMSLDEFNAAGNPLPGFLKMDIEGAEWPALHGATAILEKAEAMWMLATHSDQLRIDCRAKLASNGYRFAAFDCKTDPADENDFLVLPVSFAGTTAASFTRNPS
jgi:FkbM family methyltransferase